MKKILLIVVTTMLLLAGCSGGEKNVNTSNTTDKVSTSNPTNKNEKATIESYFPFLENSYHEYDAVGNKNVAQKYFTTYLKGNKIQQRILGGNQPTDTVLELKDSKLMAIFYSEFENAFIQNHLEDAPNSGSVILQEPLELGAKWNIDVNGSSEITNMKAEVTVPFGKFEAIEVTSVFAGGNTTKDYYVKDIGLVKFITIVDGVEVMSNSLVKYSKDEPEDTIIEVFYPDSNVEKILSKEVSFKFKTNDDMKKTIETILKTKIDEVALISEGTKINSLSADIPSNLTKLDLSEEYISEMNAGSGTESLLLECLANTLGRFAGTNDVQITIAGKNYESGHIRKEDGEYFTVTN